MARTKDTRCLTMLGSLSLLSVLAAGFSVEAKELPKRSILTLEAAQHVLQAAQKEATARGGPVSLLWSIRRG